MSQFIVAALYKFASVEDRETLADSLRCECERLGIKGTLLVAKEGINGTIAGSRASIDAILAFIKSDPRFANLTHKEAVHEEMPFHRMKVRLKREIVTMGIDDIDPRQIVGTYVPPADWNALISDPEVLLIDTRNSYECKIGTFKGAIDPVTESFREFPDYVEKNLDPSKHKKVAMFCTGGIRCEKSTAFLKAKGFEEVFHLQGGILKYLEEVPADQSLWQGECFVFDNRVSVNHSLERGSYDLCHGCRLPVHESEKASEKFVPGVCCPNCHDQLTEEKRERLAERQKQMDLAKQRNEPHIGASEADFKARTLEKLRKKEQQRLA